MKLTLVCALAIGPALNKLAEALSKSGRMLRKKLFGTGGISPTPVWVSKTATIAPDAMKLLAGMLHLCQ